MVQSSCGTQNGRLALDSESLVTERGMQGESKLPDDQSKEQWGKEKQKLWGGGELRDWGHPAAPSFLTGQ